MVERGDPGRAGVKAGRVVGLLTAGLAVASMLLVQDTYYRNVSLVLELVGLGVPLGAVFWVHAGLVATARYALAYVTGSLVAIAWDAAGRPSLVLVAIAVGGIGAVDGTLAALDTGRPALWLAYVLAWLAFVPAFARLHDPEAPTRDGPLRLE